MSSHHPTQVVLVAITCAALGFAGSQASGPNDATAAAAQKVRDDAVLSAVKTLHRDNATILKALNSLNGSIGTNIGTDVDPTLDPLTVRDGLERSNKLLFEVCRNTASGSGSSCFGSRK